MANPSPRLSLSQNRAMRLSKCVLFLALASGAAGQQLLPVHDVHLVDRELAKSVEKHGLGALDPFRSALDQLEVEPGKSEDLEQALGLTDGLDLRPLLDARSVPISEDVIVAFSPSLQTVFFRAPWVEAELLKAFFSSDRESRTRDHFVTGELWIYEAPVNQMEIHGWRKRLSMADLESQSEVRLIRYEKFGAKAEQFDGKIEVLGPPTALERSEREDFWGFGGAQRARDAHSTLTAVYSKRDGHLRQLTISNFRAPGKIEGRIISSLLAEPGKPLVIPIGFQARPKPRRWVAVTRRGEPKPRPTKAQQAAIRRWRSFNPPPDPDKAPSAAETQADAAFRAAAESLGIAEDASSMEPRLAVLRAPGNLLSLADPNGLGFPNGYSPTRPFARSGVHPEIFGNREVLDLRPFFRIGGAKFGPGSEAWSTLR